MCECSKKTLVRNVVSASDPLPFLNGKETKGFISVLVSVSPVAKKKISVKFALLT